MVLEHSGHIVRREVFQPDNPHQYKNRRQAIINAQELGNKETGICFSAFINLDIL